MSRFVKMFLRDRLKETARLAGLGKHPAWDDHIDDLGLDGRQTSGRRPIAGDRLSAFVCIRLPRVHREQKISARVTVAEQLVIQLRTLTLRTLHRKPLSHD